MRSPWKFYFPSREFEQMEMQYFVKPGAQIEAMEEWKEIRYQWHLKNGQEKIVFVGRHMVLIILLTMQMQQLILNISLLMAGVK